MSVRSRVILAVVAIILASVVGYYERKLVDEKQNTPKIDYPPRTSTAPQTEKDTQKELAKDLAALQGIIQDSAKPECEQLYQSSMDALAAAQKIESQHDNFKELGTGIAAPFHSKSAAYGIAYQNCVARSK